MQTRRKNQITKPNTKFTLTVALDPQHSHEPNSVSQALKDPNWRNAMGDEFNAQVRNDSWDLVPHNPNKNIVGCKWVYTIKRLPDGSIERYKARFVAKGFSQQPGIDYTETFSPVIKPPPFVLFFDIAVSRSWPIQ